MDAVIKKIKNFNELSSHVFKIKNVKQEIIEIVRKNYTQEKTFNEIKNRIIDKKGSVGMPLIKSFLGGNWTQSMISQALAQLKEAKKSPSLNERGL